MGQREAKLSISDCCSCREGPILEPGAEEVTGVWGCPLANTAHSFLQLPAQRLPGSYSGNCH